MKSKESIVADYEKKCGRFEVQHDKSENTTYIYTERFIAESLHTDKTLFNEFPDKIKDLFTNTFAEPNVMTKFATGAVKTQQEFEGIVRLQSSRSSAGYPFSGFIVTEQETEKVLGYEVIGNGSKLNTGQVAYLYNHRYHNSDKKKHVGYENVGALILGYGVELFQNNVCVNQTYDEKEKKFTGGSTFTTIEATARIDNIGSLKILENLGFSEVGKTTKYGHDRHEFELRYEDILLNGASDTTEGGF